MTNDDTAPVSSGSRPTVPVPAERCEQRAREVHEYCKGLSFGAALACAVFEKGDVL